MEFFHCFMLCKCSTDAHIQTIGIVHAVMFVIYIIIVV